MVQLSFPVNFNLDILAKLKKFVSRGSATPMKMGRGDGDQAAAKPGFSSEDNPYQKPKTQRIWPTIFLKMRGLSPALSKLGGGGRVPRPPCGGAPGISS